MSVTATPPLDDIFFFVVWLFVSHYFFLFQTSFPAPLFIIPPAGGVAAEAFRGPDPLSPFLVFAATGFWVGFCKMDPIGVVPLAFFFLSPPFPVPSRLGFFFLVFQVSEGRNFLLVFFLNLPQCTLLESSFFARCSDLPPP